NKLPHPHRLLSGFEGFDAGYEVVPLRFSGEPVGTVLPISPWVALGALCPVLTVSACIALRALRTLQIRAIDTIHNNGGAIPGNLGRVPVGTVLPISPWVALGALRSLSSTSRFDPIQLGGSNRRAASLPVLPVIRLECHQFPPPG